jgi:HK97 family phage prohead protease
LERRSFSIDRASSSAGPGGIRFKGHAAVFGQRTWIATDWGGFWEEVSKTAFDRALEEDDVALLLEHDPRWILGRNTAGTLRLAKDKAGLAVESDFPNTTYANDAAESLSRGDLRAMSFAFTVREDEEGRPIGQTIKETKEGPVRTLTDVRLWDVSVVAFPAYEGTDAALRAIQACRADETTGRLLALRRRFETIERNM